MKKGLAPILAVGMTILSLTACGKTSASGGNDAVAVTTNISAAATANTTNADTKSDKLVEGFAQIGQESGWRDAETASIQGYAKDNADAVTFQFADAQQKQENQIRAIRSFTEMKADVIGLAPVVETGWDAVFTEAKEAGIPIVLVDRMAEVPDDLIPLSLVRLLTGNDITLHKKWRVF